ncbi:MAG: hypothetical protein ACFCGT_16410 [Sandaracinaceae bacterium]
MVQDEVKTEREGGARRRGWALAGLLVVLVAPAALTLQWSRPRPIAPVFGPPPLVLEPGAVRAVVAGDGALARRAPTGPAAEERRRRYHAVNVAEHEGGDHEEGARYRRRQLANALRRLAQGDREVVRAVRAADLEAVQPALRGELPAGDRVALLGGFPMMLERYGMVRAGRQAAPTFVVRTVFKARWNAVHGEVLTADMSPVELQAYHGWLALHGAGAPIERRLLALSRYAEAGGARAAEAEAILRCENDLPQSDQALARARAERGTFLFRNIALGCVARAAADDPG